MALALTIDSVDQVSKLVRDSLTVDQTSDGLNSTCSFDLFDKDVFEKDAWTVGVTRVEDGDVITGYVAWSQDTKVEVSVTDGATTYFAGILSRVGITHLGKEGLTFHCDCHDFNQMVEESVVDSLEEYGAATDEEIIDDIFTEYVTGIDFATHVTGPFVSDEISFDGVTVRNVLDTLAAKSGYVWYIDYSKKLHYKIAGEDAPAWHLSDDPDDVNSFSYFDDITKELDATNLVNQVLIVGGSVSLWFQDAASMAEYGSHKAIVRDTNLVDIDDMEDRGDAILAKHKDPVVTYRLRTYQDGLRAGMYIRVVCALYDVDDTFLVNQLTITFPIDGDPEYEIVCSGLKSPSSGGAAAQRLALDYKQAVPAITPGQLPIASRGWVHDLEFSATDNDTVAWTAGTITTASSQTFSIDAGNTDDPAAMAATSYVYLDTAISDTELQITTDPFATIGTFGRILVAVAKNVETGKNATFQVFGGEGLGVLIVADNIAADTITGNEIAANTIEASEIAAAAITAAELDASYIIVTGAAGDVNAGVTTIAGGKITTGTITTTQIAATTILAGDIAANTITTDQIAANTILAGNIASGAIQTDELDALAVTAAKIAANTITADKIDMGMGDLIYNTADGLLLLNSHGEINATEWWSQRKQKAALSGAFHQEAGRWPGTRGLVIERGTTNLIANPSFETNITDFWTQQQDGAGGAWARSSSRSTHGSYSVEITAGNNRTVLYSDNVAVPDAQTVTLSANVFTPTSGGSTRIRIYDVTNSTWRASTAAEKAGQWHRLTATWTNDTGGAVNVRIYLNNDYDDSASKTYFDAIQAELLTIATTYCDGTLGSGYTWAGTAHNSNSTRTATQANLDAHVALISDKNVQSFRLVVQAPYNADATWSANYLMDAYDAGGRIIISFDSAVDKLKVHAFGTAILESGVLTFKAGDWLDIVVTLDYVNDNYYLYLNGVEVDSDTATNLASAPLTQWNLGSKYDGSNQAGATYDELAVCDKELTAAEVAGMYALQRPLVDAGAMEAPGIYILDGRFKIASSTTGNRIEINADEVAGYNSAGAKQFYLQASDGKAMAGAGNVILDADGVTLLEGTSQTSFVKWTTSGGSRTGYVASDWAGGAGDDVVTWVLADDTVSGANAAVILVAKEGANETRLNINTNLAISAARCNRLLFASTTPTNWLDLNSDASSSLLFNDAAGARTFSFKDSAVATVFQVNSDGDTRILGGLYIGSVGSDAPTGEIRCTEDLRAGKGIVVGDTAVDPPDNCLCFEATDYYITKDSTALKVYTAGTSRLHVSSAGIDARPNKIFFSGGTQYLWRSGVDLYWYDGTNSIKLN